jgi:hypothetical protein
MHFRNYSRKAVSKIAKKNIFAARNDLAFIISEMQFENSLLKNLASTLLLHCSQKFPLFISE